MLLLICIFLYFNFIVSTVYHVENKDYTPLTMNPMVYHLLLRDEHHYVGITYNLNQDYSFHINGQGNEWTTLYKPYSIKKIWTEGTIELVNKITLDLIYQYGKEKVRGGKYMDLHFINDEISDEYQLGDDVLIPREYCPFTEVNTLVVNHLHYIIATVIDVSKYLLTYQYIIEQNVNSTSFYTDRIAIKNIYKNKNIELDKIMKFRETEWVQSALHKLNVKQNYEIIHIDSSWFCKYNNIYKLIEYDKTLSYSGISNGGKCINDIEKTAILYKIYNEDFRVYNKKNEYKDIFWQLFFL